MGFKVPRGRRPVSHLAFTDHVIIFANGYSASLKNIMQVLELYQKMSGQLVNTQKCGYLVQPSTSPACRRVIERIAGFSR